MHEKSDEPTLKASDSWHTLVVAVGTVVAGLTGSGVWVSHGSVSSKLDQVLVSQQTLEIKFAKIESHEDRLQKLDDRLRVIEIQGAETHRRERLQDQEHSK